MSLDEMLIAAKDLAQIGLAQRAKMQGSNLKLSLLSNAEKRVQQSGDAIRIIIAYNSTAKIAAEQILPYADKFLIDLLGYTKSAEVVSRIKRVQLIVSRRDFRGLRPVLFKEYSVQSNGAGNSYQISRDGFNFPVIRRYGNPQSLSHADPTPQRNVYRI